MTKTQAFTLSYMLREEWRFPAESYGADYPSRHIISGDSIHISTLRALEKQGLVISYESEKSRSLRRGGNAVVKVGYSKRENVTRWKLTKKGRAKAMQIAKENGEA